MASQTQTTNAYWLLLSKSDRVHAGNDGYADDLDSSYTWDDTVPNYDRLSIGDVIAVWDGKRLLGVSVIGNISKGDATKSRNRCTNCNTTNIRQRKSSTPEYKCAKCKTEFNSPKIEQLPVVTYTTNHQAGWMSATSLINASELRGACESKISQHSMRPLDEKRFNDLLKKHSEVITKSFVTHVQNTITGGHKKATVRIRVGQPAFRKSLLDKYGDNCAVTDPSPREAIQACHLYSFAKSGKHENQGGMLLRSDLHTLFDRGLLKVDVKSGKTALHPRLKKFPAYWIHNNEKLKISLTPKQKKWLRDHWNQHPF